MLQFIRFFYYHRGTPSFNSPLFAKLPASTECIHLHFFLYSFCSLYFYFSLLLECISCGSCNLSWHFHDFYHSIVFYYYVLTSLVTFISYRSFLSFFVHFFYAFVTLKAEMGFLPAIIYIIEHYATAIC